MRGWGEREREQKERKKEEVKKIVSLRGDTSGRGELRLHADQAAVMFLISPLFRKVLTGLLCSGLINCFLLGHLVQKLSEHIMRFITEFDL